MNKSNSCCTSTISSRLLVVINLQNKEIDAANEGILNQNPIQALAAAIPTAVNMTLENPHASKNNDTDPCLLRR